MSHMMQSDPTVPRSTSFAQIAAALIAFGLLQSWKVPPWLVVLLMAAAGQWFLR
jgi:hypothetical protein